MDMPDVQALVQSVANKQQQNKRKRDPDMYLDAVLECTVRKLNRERMERDEALRKRRKIEDPERTGYCASANVSLSEKRSIKCARIASNYDTTDAIDTDCDLETNLVNLDDELSGDLKDLLDELSREFPCDFWHTDTTNNNSPHINSKDSEGESWLSSFIEVLCST